MVIEYKVTKKLRISGKYLVGSCYHASFSLAIILFASPLFQVLGFEFSALSALGSSIWIMLMASKRAASEGKFSTTLLKSVLLEGLLYGLIPLAISLLSVIFIPNCALGDGLLFYIQIVPFTIVIAVLLGIPIGLCTAKNNWRIILVWSSWLLWLLISLLPGYFGPQIFVYGWQYGYFPGLVWDEALELQSAYWWSTAMLLLAASLPLLLPKRSVVYSFALPMVSAVALEILLTVVYPGAGVLQTTYIVEEELSSTLSNRGGTVHFKPGSLTLDEEQFIRYELGADYDSILAFYHLPVSSFHFVDIYLYPSVTELYKYVGTRSASISKPWRSELHIAKENLRSLKHELVHVLLAPKGNFPFAVSYSTGITEGAAECIEETYNGIHTVNELSAAIVELKLASGITDVMSFTGFASNASAKSYVLAGSFSDYLISHYGPEKFLKLYSSLDYEEMYSKSLTELEYDWLAWLKLRPLRMSASDSARTNFYFARRSILMQPCLRRIGKQLTLARQLFQDKNYAEADFLYKQVAAESGRLEAIQGRVLCLIRQKKYREALQVLDTTASANEEKNRIALHTMRGDILFLTSSTFEEATEEWTKTIDLELSSDRLLNSYARLICLGRSSDTLLAREFLLGLYSEAPTSRHLDSLLVDLPTFYGNESFFSAMKYYLLARLSESRGELRNAMQLLEPIASFARQTIDLRSDDVTSKAFHIIVKRYERYRRAFTPQ